MNGAVPLGRFAEPALWILVILRRGPAPANELLRAVRSVDGPVGPGTLLAALARLEHRALIRRVAKDRVTMYRLASDRDGAEP